MESNAERRMHWAIFCDFFFTNREIFFIIVVFWNPFVINSRKNNSRPSAVQFNYLKCLLVFASVGPLGYTVTWVPPSSIKMHLGIYSSCNWCSVGVRRSVQWMISVNNITTTHEWIKTIFFCCILSPYLELALLSLYSTSAIITIVRLQFIVSWRSLFFLLYFMPPETYVILYILHCYYVFLLGNN